MIVLVNIASEFRGVEAMNRPPAGLLYVGGALKKAGYLVTVLHISAADIKEVAEEVVQMRPLFVGVSLFTGLPARYSAIFSKEVKKLDPKIPIVWGGVHPSLLPEQCLSQSYVDIVCVGEGEETAREIADVLSSHASLSKIKGIGFKKNGEVMMTEQRPLAENLDAFEMDWSLLDINNYVHRIEGLGAASPFITSRGCPFSCGFCYNYKFNRRRWRAHSVEFVIDHIKQIKVATNANFVFFDDDNFFGNKKRALLILHRLYELGIYCSFLELRVDSITPGIMKELRDLKVKRIFVGWEAGSDRILNLITKGFDKNTIIEKCKILAGFPEVEVDASAIIGFPTETRREIEETINLATVMAEIVPNINFNIGTYLPYPGTKLYELAINEGFMPPNNPEEWGDFDILAGNIKLKWLPWATEKESEIFRRIDRYSKLLHHTPSRHSGLNLIKQAVYHLAKFRLRRGVVSFPFEIIGYEWWLRHNVKKFRGEKGGQ